MCLLYKLVLPLLLDLFLSSVLELVLDTLDSAFVDYEQRHIFRPNVFVCDYVLAETGKSFSLKSDAFQDEG